jgi:excisionase family DNA binding protein
MAEGPPPMTSGRSAMAEWALNMADVCQPSVVEIDAARRAAGQLSQLDRGEEAVRLGAGPGRDAILLPAALFRALLRMVDETGKGNAVAVVPVEAELTTQQAADLLNVSRPHLVKLIARGELPCRMVGTHRKLPMREVLAYHATRAAEGGA